MTLIENERFMQRFEVVQRKEFVWKKRKTFQWVGQVLKILT